MTERPGASEVAVSGFPAPGSRVPGAPPALKRALTPADGVRYASEQDAEPAPEPVGPVSGHPSRSSFTLAAAMAGIAVGLELARLSSCRGVRCYLRQINTFG